MRSIKLVTGVVLIVVAITGFTFWESHGRDMLYETCFRGYKAGRAYNRKER